MIKVFFDASVLIAALISSKGASRQLFKYSSTKIVSIVSQTVINEVKTNLHKFKGITQRDLDNFISRNKIFVRRKVFKGEISQLVAFIEEKDAHVLAGAILTQCHYLVSLDKKHIVKNETKRHFKNLQIVLPRDLLAIIKEDI